MSIGDKQRRILAFGYTGYTAIVCNGAVRSGKTSIMTVAFVDWAMRNFNGCAFALCSKTVNACYRNVIRPYLALAYVRKRYGVRVRQTENYMEITRGDSKNTFYIFGGRDESSYMLIQGITLAGVFLDEAPLMPESFVNQAIARCSVDGRKLWFNCNPAGSKEHWFYKEWIGGAKEKNALLLNFNIDDNPSLSEDIKNGYKTMYHGVFYRRYILGEWVAAEGSLFQEVPSFTQDASLLRDGIAHIDAAYGGEDYTALTCGKRDGDAIYLYGRLWRAHVDTVLDAALNECSRLMCAPVWCETNGDKGYLAKEIRNRGTSPHAYPEAQNKYLKISTYLRKWWSHVVFLEGTDPAYVAQIMDYTEEAEHDDAPDSAACVCRTLDRPKRESLIE